MSKLKNQVSTDGREHIFVPSGLDNYERGFGDGVREQLKEQHSQVIAAHKAGLQEASQAHQQELDNAVIATEVALLNKLLSNPGLLEETPGRALHSLMDVIYVELQKRRVK